MMSENPDDRINKYSFMDGLKVSLWVVKKTESHKQALKDLERLYEIVEAHDWEMLISSVESHYGFAVSNLS